MASTGSGPASEAVRFGGCFGREGLSRLVRSSDIGLRLPWNEKVSIHIAFIYGIKCISLHYYLVSYLA